MRVILGWLSDKDHDRYLRSYALCMMVIGGHPELSKVEAQQAIVDDQRLFAELREKYAIDETENVKISLYDGAIVEDEV